MDRTYRPSRRRNTSVHEARLIAALVSGLGLLGACTDRTETTRPLLAAKSATSFAASPAALHASTISFDTELDVERPGGPTRTMRAHVDDEFRKRRAGARPSRSSTTLARRNWRPRRGGQRARHRPDRAAHDVPGRRPGFGKSGPRSSGAGDRRYHIDVKYRRRRFRSRNRLDGPVVRGLGRSCKGEQADAHWRVGGSARCQGTGSLWQGRSHSYYRLCSGSGDRNGEELRLDGRAANLDDGIRIVNTASGLSIRTRSHVEQAGGKFAGSRTITIQHVVVDGQEVAS